MDRTDLARILGAKPRESDLSPEVVVIDQRDPDRFMTEFADACAGTSLVFLADPGWGEAQRNDFHRILHGAHKPGADGRGWLLIPSGGSSGGLKFSRHDEGTITAAVKGFCTHFSMAQVNAVGLLPLWHVSGFAAWMRTVLTGGEYVPWEWKDVEKGTYPIPAAEGACLSLVPTQLQRLLGQPEAVDWLTRFSVVFLGGGPAWSELTQEAAAAGLPLSLSYGMTETLAMVSAVTPLEFLAGDRTNGRAMPQVAIDLTDEGLVRVESESVHLGYYPDFSAKRSFTTQDLGEISADGRLTILGRRDALIITGGKKVDPLIVEEAARASGQFRDLAVIGTPDSKWGQAVILCYPASQDAPDEGLEKEAFSTLALHERPKRVLAVSPWPRNAQGKVNRSELAKAVQTSETSP